MITDLFTRQWPAWRPQLLSLLISCYANLLSHDLLFAAGWWAAVLLCSYKSFLSCKSYIGADVRIWKPPSRASSLNIKPSYTTSGQDNYWWLTNLLSWKSLLLWIVNKIPLAFGLWSFKAVLTEFVDHVGAAETCYKHNITILSRY